VPGRQQRTEQRDVNACSPVRPLQGRVWWRDAARMGPLSL